MQEKREENAKECGKIHVASIEANPEMQQEREGEHCFRHKGTMMTMFSSQEHL